MLNFVYIYLLLLTLNGLYDYIYQINLYIKFYICFPEDCNLYFMWSLFIKLCIDEV